MRRGELYRVFQPSGDPKQYRAFVIVSRQALIEARFSTVICAPVYTNGSGLSTQVSVGAEEGLKHQSWVHCDNLSSIPKSALTQYLGSLSRSKLFEVEQALTIALDLPV
jgi:mRNA interferase MazF